MNLFIFICSIAFNLPNKLHFFNNIYDKKISYKTIFDNKKNIFKKNNYKKILNLRDDYSIIKNNYNNREIINNEIDFTLNKKIKIYIHLEQLISNTNIYHIGITYKTILYKVRFDIGTFERFNFNVLEKNKKTKKIFWDYTNKTLEEIIYYENNMEYKYFLGFYDCRHYVRNLTSWSCNNPTPIWKLYTYF
jgi:hypothetical protein